MTTHSKIHKEPEMPDEMWIISYQYHRGLGWRTFRFWSESEERAHETAKKMLTSRPYQYAGYVLFRMVKPEGGR